MICDAGQSTGPRIGVILKRLDFSIVAAGDTDR